MQFHAAPAKAFIQQMRECRSLTEVPFPATLTGKGFGEVWQVWRFVRGDDFRFYTLAIMGEKALVMASQTCSWVIPGNSSVRLVTRERTEVMPFAASFFLSGLR